MDSAAQKQWNSKNTWKRSLKVKPLVLQMLTAAKTCPQHVINNFSKRPNSEFIPVSVSIRQDKNHCRLPLVSSTIGPAASHHTYRLCIPAFQHESSWPWTALQSVLVFLLPLESLKPVPKREWINTPSSIQCQAAEWLKTQDRFTVDYPYLHPEVCSHLGPVLYSYTQDGPKDSWQRTQPITSVLLANTSNLKLMHNGKKFRASCKLFPMCFPSPRAA